MKHNAATQRERIRQYLYANTHGTRNEIGKAKNILTQTMCARLDELEELGHVVRLGRRICSETGSMNIEYRLSGNQRAAMARKGVAA